MIKRIIKQIWASKRANGWIFTELLVVFVATWLVVDPLYTLFYQTKLFPFGFEPENVFCLNISSVPEDAARWSKEASVREAVLRDFDIISGLVKSYPGVSAATPAGNQFVYSGSYSGSLFRSSSDSTKSVNAQFMPMFHGSDYFKVFRFKDARTGRWDVPDSVPYVENGVFITSLMEQALFGEGNGTGKMLEYSKSSSKKFRVLGVLENFKGQSCVQHGPVMIMMMPDYHLYDTPGRDESSADFLSSFLNWSEGRILFRINDRLDRSLFLSGFKKELMPKLSSGNLYVRSIHSLQDMYNNDVDAKGVSAKIRLQSVFALFFMINIVLAVFATFWLRIRKRSCEIGLMRAVGSTGRGVRNFFIAESLLIFAMAALTGIIVLIQIVYFKGLYSYNFGKGYGEIIDNNWYAWFINNGPAHFTVVTLIVLTVIGSMVILATWAPARRAAKMLPTDALRDE